MVTIYAKFSCGCCDAEMHFHNLDNARAAFAKAGVLSSATVRDDRGETHEGVDTFYDFWTEEEAAHDLGYLLEKVARL